MRIINLFLLLITSMICFSSCVGYLSGDNHGKPPVQNEKQASSRIEQIVQAINAQDKEALKELFSASVLENAEDFDKNLDALFAYIEGNVESWEEANGPTVTETANQGAKKKEIKSFFYVITQHEKYFFQLEDCVMDTVTPENVGLSLLVVVTEENHMSIYYPENKILFDYGFENGEIKSIKLPRFGIYLPFA